MEIKKDESYPLPKVPGVLYWLLLWLLHYWIKSLRLHLRARETEEGGGQRARPLVMATSTDEQKRKKAMSVAASLHFKLSKLFYNQ